jgi:hypothetical protein
MAIVAVFLPVALMPGIAGQFFKSFGYTVVIGADEPVRRADDHAADRRLFPALARRPAARRWKTMDRISASQLEPRYEQGGRAARAAFPSPPQVRLLVSPMASAS